MPIPDLFQDKNNIEEIKFLEKEIWEKHATCYNNLIDRRMENGEKLILALIDLRPAVHSIKRTIWKWYK